MPKTSYAISRRQWNGIEIEIRWDADYMHFDDERLMGHLEIESVSPASEPLPMTRTGYRSHFIQPQIIDEAGGPDAYVALWLTQEAQTPEWRATDTNRRQLALF